MKVKFTCKTSFEGRLYEQGEVADLPQDKVAALGNTVAVMEEASKEAPKQEAKAVEDAPINKQVKKAPKKK